MKKIIFLLLSAAIMSSCGSKNSQSESSGETSIESFDEVPAIPQSGNACEKRYKVSNFSNLEVSDAINVEFCDGISEVIVSADSSVIGYVEIKQDGNTLSIGYTDGVNINNTKNPTTVKVPTQANLASIKASGASTVTATVKGNLDVNLCGSSNANLSGTLGNLNVDISGASSISSDDNQLTVSHVKGSLSGASSMSILCDGSIACDLSGASTIVYSGNANTSGSNCTGASSINCETQY